MKRKLFKFSREQFEEIVEGYFSVYKGPIREGYKDEMLFSLIFSRFEMLDLVTQSKSLSSRRNLAIRLKKIYMDHMDKIIESLFKQTECQSKE